MAGPGIDLESEEDGLTRFAADGGVVREPPPLKSDVRHARWTKSQNE